MHVPTFSSAASSLLAASSIILLSLPAPTLAQDQVTFPINWEIDLVLPRNDTYAVVSPFPIIFAFQNSHGLLSYPTQFSWSVDCKGGSLGGFGRLSGTRNGIPSADPYFFANISKSLAQLADEGRSQPLGNVAPFPYWLSSRTEDQCTLEWDFDYSVNCSSDGKGGLWIGNTFKAQGGKVGFTLKPGGKLPADDLAAYATDSTRCPVYMDSTQVAKNETGCANIGAPKPSASPCSLKIGAAQVTSILAELPTPTVTFTPTGTSSGTSKSTSTGTSGGSSSGDSGLRSGGDDKKDAASSLRGGATMSMVCLVASVIGALMVLL